MTSILLKNRITFFTSSALSLLATAPGCGNRLTSYQQAINTCETYGIEPFDADLAYDTFVGLREDGVSYTDAAGPVVAACQDSVGCTRCFTSLVNAAYGL